MNTRTFRGIQSWRNLARQPRVQQFIKFSLVGGSGVVVDMIILHILAGLCGWDVTLSKLCAAEIAMLNNFFWNEHWTFRGPAEQAHNHGMLRRLGWFHVICGAGIGLAVGFLHLFYHGLGLNLYLANLLAIGIVTLWNFWLNALFNWRRNSRSRELWPGAETILAPAKATQRPE